MPRLTTEILLDAYRQGLFPMADSRGSIAFYEADPRGIIPLDAHHVPQRLRRYMKQFEFAFDRDVGAVIDGCADRPETWISPEIKRAYLQLHREGIVHSVEAWKGGKLAGGLYGVHVGGAFMAESMFHSVSNASGASVVTLIEHLVARGFVLLDIQQVLSTTARFGAVNVSKANYLKRLEAALRVKATWR